MYDKSRGTAQTSSDYTNSPYLVANEPNTEATTDGWHVQFQSNGFHIPDWNRTALQFSFQTTSCGEPLLREILWRSSMPTRCRCASYRSSWVCARVLFARAATKRITLARTSSVATCDPWEAFLVLARQAAQQRSIRATALRMATESTTAYVCTSTGH